MDTVNLVNEARAGDKDALLKLVMVQQLDYYRLAFTYLGNQDEAMDALEDMIIILFKQIGKLKKAESFYSWSRTILANGCRKRLKNRKKLISIEELSPRDVSLLVEENAAILQQIELEKHLAMLPVKYQEVLKLRYYLDYDYQTIAGLLNIPLGTVKSRISIGLKLLKASMGGNDDE